MSARSLSIGFARLSDCAPLVAAKETGAFAKQGLDVALTRFDSWAAMRDALAHGAIDAAHMLSPMVIASAAGLEPPAPRFRTAFIFNLNGNSITVSEAIYEEMRRIAPQYMNRRPLTASALKALIDLRRARGERQITLAYVYHFSMHAYELRYWLAAAGIDPRRDVRLVVTPPSLMAEALASGAIDGFCVGEPWGEVAASEGSGRTLITSCELWPGKPEKALAVRADWADANSDIHRLLISALLQAAIWLDPPANRLAAARMLAKPDYVDMDVGNIAASLTGEHWRTGGSDRASDADFNVFHRYAANFPWRSHAKWILSQMIRWGEAPPGIGIEAIADAAYDCAFYRETATALGVPCPTVDERIEGAHPHAWLLSEATSPIACAANRFLDGRVFDPADIEGYISADTFGT